MKASGRNIVVFYGSQTGTAEEFAGRLAKEAARYGMKALVADPEECEMVLHNFHAYTELCFYEHNFPCNYFRKNCPNSVKSIIQWLYFAWPHTEKVIRLTTHKLFTSGFSRATLSYPGLISL